MKVELLAPDIAPQPPARESAGMFATILGDLGSALGGATRAEDAFATGSGSLQDAVYERARADVALSVAVSAAQRTAQAIQSITNMQI